MKRLSGGRGEYEVAEHAGVLGPHDLIGKRLRWRLPPFRDRETGIEVRAQGGKPRLRIATPNAIHVHRQLAAILLLPKPIRDETRLVGRAPVIRENQYVMRRMDLADVRVGTATLIRPGRIEADNGSGLVKTLDALDRLSRVHRIHELADEFPPGIRGALRQHEALLASTVALGPEIERVVSRLMESAAINQSDLGAEYVAGADVLPLLERGMSLTALTKPTVPEEEEEVEIRRREASRIRRWAAARGVSSARFRRAVREAYDARCVACGLRLPPGPDCEVPGVDAAHILPWAEYDLDVTANGLCLCKLHHWAFDQQLIAIEHTAGVYSTRVTTRGRRALSSDPATLRELERVEGPIPESRLPRAAGQRPKPQFLEALYSAVPPDES